MKNYIIYLPDFKISTGYASYALKTGLHLGWEISLFEGINGKLVESNSDWNKWGISINNVNTKCRKLLQKPGVRGCFLSHWVLWNKCVDSGVPIGIFEHDIEFLKSPIDFSTVDFPHILKLEGFELRSPRPAGQWYEGARAYILKPEGAERLISWVKSNGCLPADVNIGDQILDITLYEHDVVRTFVSHASKEEKHTNSFTWNLSNMN